MANKTVTIRATILEGASCSTVLDMTNAAARSIIIDDADRPVTIEIWGNGRTVHAETHRPIGMVPADSDPLVIAPDKIVVLPEWVAHIPYLQLHLDRPAEQTIVCHLLCEIRR